MQGQNISKISDADLPQLLTRQGTTMLLISSSWDGHGIIMRALLGNISDHYVNVVFEVANVENSPRICKLFNVSNPPALLLVKDGELVERVMGAVAGGEIKHLLENNS